jgi:DNA polymerase II small subunit/DNA polymerase delta subunit B
MGGQIDDMIGLIPGASYDKSGQMMEEMLQRRHLAPAYGRKTPIAPGRHDPLIIDPLPEILHTGHLHVKGITSYRGVLRDKCRCMAVSDFVSKADIREPDTGAGGCCGPPDTYTTGN